MGMIDSIADGKDNDPGGIIQAIPNGKAGDLLEIIRSGMLANNKKPAAENPFWIIRGSEFSRFKQISFNFNSWWVKETCGAKKWGNINITRISTYQTRPNTKSEQRLIFD